MTAGLLFFFIGLVSWPVISQIPASRGEANLIVAREVGDKLAINAAHPAKEWQRAIAVSFSADWQGKNADAGRKTTVRVLWSPETLYLRYECLYRELYVFSDSEPSGRRDRLWERDVAEAFLQPDPSKPAYYKEFEVSPNGFWIDLEIYSGKRRDLESMVEHSTSLQQGEHRWAAELAIPMKALVEHVDVGDEWHANFYRIEGNEDRRFYSAWRPTGTPQPNFHVPSAFGRLRFTR